MHDILTNDNICTQNIVTIYELKELEPTDNRLFLIPLQMSAALSKLKSDEGGPSMLICIKQSSVNNSLNVDACILDLKASF